MKKDSSVKAPRLTLHITKQLIESSVPEDSAHCFTAEAVRQARPEAIFVAADWATIRFSDRKAGLRYIYFTPEPIQRALFDFDSGILPKPFSVELRIGQVVPFGAGYRRKLKTAKEIRDSRAAIQQAKKPKRRAPERMSSSPHGTGVPTRVGGKAPPKARVNVNGERVPFSRIRAFGLRSLKNARADRIKEARNRKKSEQGREVKKRGKK